ncbi:hypothetical protein [Streptomyces sp. NPDC050538]|uniref:hypothetical protein n=1 Tax=Streptomyces sp. NPDC050538 TaxID=3365627 RepID=UPI00379819EF
MTTPEEAAIELHLRRIVDGHGLDESTARAAAAAYRRGERGVHHDVAHHAALEVLGALLDRNAEAMLATIRAELRRRLDMRPPTRETFRRIAAGMRSPDDGPGPAPTVVVEPTLARQPRRPPGLRPWQSPYGPQPRRSRGR